MGFFCVKFNSNVKGDVFIHICPVHLLFFGPVGSLVHLSLLVVIVHLYLSKFCCLFGRCLLTCLSQSSFPSRVSECLLFLTIYKIKFKRARVVEKLQFMYLKKRCNNIIAHDVKICL